MTAVADRAALERVDDRLVQEIAGEVARTVGTDAMVAAVWPAQKALAETVADRARGLRSAASSGPEARALVAVMPWRWQAVRERIVLADRSVELHDDPAHVELLRVASAMPAGSVSVVVAGLGFLARPGTHTVARALGDAGLAVESVRQLSPRLFPTISSVPRLLIVLSKKKVAKRSNRPDD